MQESGSPKNKSIFFTDIVLYSYGQNNNDDEGMNNNEEVFAAVNVSITGFG